MPEITKMPISLIWAHQQLFAGLVFFCLFDTFFELEHCNEKSLTQLGCWNRKFLDFFSLQELDLQTKCDRLKHTQNLFVQGVSRI